MNKNDKNYLIGILIGLTLVVSCILFMCFSAFFFIMLVIVPADIAKDNDPYNISTQYYYKDWLIKVSKWNVQPNYENNTKYIDLFIEFENRSNTEAPVFVSENSFYLKYNNYIYKSINSTNLKDEFEYKYLTPAYSTKGWVRFEIPKDALTFELYYKDENSGLDKSIKTINLPN